MISAFSNALTLFRIPGSPAVFTTEIALPAKASSSTLFTEAEMTTSVMPVIPLYGSALSLLTPPEMTICCTSREPHGKSEASANAAIPTEARRQTARKTVNTLFMMILSHPKFRHSVSFSVYTSFPMLCQGPSCPVFSFPVLPTLRNTSAHDR